MERNDCKATCTKISVWRFSETLTVGTQTATIIIRVCLVVILLAGNFFHLDFFQYLQTRMHVLYCLNEFEKNTYRVV